MGFRILVGLEVAILTLVVGTIAQLAFDVFEFPELIIGISTIGAGIFSAFFMRPMRLAMSKYSTTDADLTRRQIVTLGAIAMILPIGAFTWRALTIPANGARICVLFCCF